MKPASFHPLLLTLALALPFSESAQDAPPPEVQLHSDGDLQTLLEVYGRMAKRKVWLAADVPGSVHVYVAEKGATAAVFAALKLILLEKYGITLRETPDGQAFAEWSDDLGFSDLRNFRVKNITSNPSRDDPRVSIPLDTVMKTFAFYTKRTVAIARDVPPKLAIAAIDYGDPAGVPDVMRKFLLENYGLTIREVEDWKVLVEWSDDPKYRELRKPKPADMQILPQPDGVPKRRVRIMKSSDAPPQP